jgi:hypothetical protein
MKYFREPRKPAPPKPSDWGHTGGTFRNKIKLTEDFIKSFCYGENKKPYFVEFDFSDQVRDTNKDESFAQRMALEYGVPVKCGDGWVEP